MSAQTVGWVLDKDTSQRRIHLYLIQSGAGLTVEVYGQPSCVVELDEDGVVILRGLLGQALARLATEQGV